MELLDGSPSTGDLVVLDQEFQCSGCLGSLEHGDDLATVLNHSVQLGVRARCLQLRNLAHKCANEDHLAVEIADIARGARLSICELVERDKVALPTGGDRCQLVCCRSSSIHPVEAEIQLEGISLAGGVCCALRHELGAPVVLHYMECQCELNTWEGGGGGLTRAFSKNCISSSSWILMPLMRT